MSLLSPTKRAVDTFPCDASLLYEILTDYDSYVEWLPNLSQSKSLATEGDLAIAEFHGSGKKKERLVVECIHTRNKMVLWRTIEGKIPVTQVEWTLEPAGENQTRLTVAVTRRLHWSALFAGTGRFLQPASALKGLRSQASSYLPELAVAGEQGERLLELSETEEGVVCWIRGKKYVLKEETSR
ncbi:MAG TPA: SRPBCC family protein [Terriglobia bacterium]|nr:SRPBCC family protein [Terriglobia bacterium]